MARLRERAAVALLLAGLAGCSSRKSVRIPSLSPEQSGQEALGQYDTNRDGAIAGDELAACPGLKAGLRAIDSNRDSRLTPDEIAARIQKYKTDQTYLFMLHATVTLDGKPLDGAVVTLVPESFMGSSYKPARGTTAPNGYCEFQSEGQTLSGVLCGIYRIEVSKKDANGQESVPAKYNTATTLGFELGSGSAAARDGLELSLSGR